jgi:hypothetical protein
MATAIGHDDDNIIISAAWRKCERDAGPHFPLPSLDASEVDHESGVVILRNSYDELARLAFKRRADGGYRFRRLEVEA